MILESNIRAPVLLNLLNSQHITDITNESQEVSPFPAGDHEATINRRAQKYNKHSTETTQMTHKRSTALERSVKTYNWRAQTGPTAPTPPHAQTRTKTHKCLVRMKDPQPTNAPPPIIYKQDTKRRQSKDKDPTVNKTEYQSKEIQQACLVFYHFSPTRLINSTKHEHICKIRYVIFLSLCYIIIQRGTELGKISTWQILKIGII